MGSKARLAEEGRARVRVGMGSRELAAQALVGVLFVVAAGLLLVLAPIGRIPVVDLVLLVLAAALLGRLEFEIGVGFTVPTQLVFVPILR